MVRSESDLAKGIRKFSRGSVHLSFVESHESARGIPDVSYTAAGKTGWMELKYGTIRRPPYLRISQMMWFQNNIRAGGSPVILVAMSKPAGVKFGVINGHKYLMVYACSTLSCWEKLCDITSCDLNHLLSLFISVLSLNEVTQ